MKSAQHHRNAVKGASLKIEKGGETGILDLKFTHSEWQHKKKR